MSDKQYPIGGYAPGNYQCTCCTCGNGFIGDKRAVQCEPCAITAKEAFEALTPEEQAEVMKRSTEAIKEFFKISEPEYRGQNSHCKACEDEAAGIKSLTARKHTCRKRKEQ